VEKTDVGKNQVQWSCLTRRNAVCNSERHLGQHMADLLLVADIGSVLMIHVGEA
jgi:hypothetical protein